MNLAQTGTLAGRRILVAEDEWALMDDVVAALTQEGAEVVGPVSTLAAGLALGAEEGRIDGALLDVNLQGEMVWPLVDILLGRGVPVVLATGYDANTLPQAYADLPHGSKPARERALIGLLVDAMNAPPPAPRTAPRFGEGGAPGPGAGPSVSAP